MAFMFCDGFDSYASGADLTKKWRTAAAPWTWNATAGRFGGGAVVAATTGGGALQTQINLSAGGGPSVGFHFKASAPPASLSSLFGGYSAAASITIELKLDTGGHLACYCQGSAAPPLPNLVNVCDNAWHWIEVATSNSFGLENFTVYVDGINQGTVVAAGSTAPFSSGYYQFTSVAGITVTLDDLVCWDTSAAPMNAFPIGSRLITTLRPTSDGTVGFATLSAGTTHFSLVNEVNPDGDTTYVEDGTAGNQDLLNFGALGYTPANISCVVANAYMKTGVAGTIANQMVCKSGATTTPSASTATTATYTTVQGGFVVDPNTSAAWTAAGLNAAQFGYKNA